MQCKSSTRIRFAALLSSALGAAVPGLAFQQLGDHPLAPDYAPPLIVSGPALLPNPNPDVPLVAIIALRTNEPTQIELALKDGTRSWTVLAEPEFKTDHEVPVLQVRTSRTHRITVTARDAAGNETRAPQELVWTTPGFPALFPPMQTTVNQTNLMEPGVIFFNATNDRFHPTYLIIVDNEGEVVWFYETDHQTSDARRLRNGNFLYLAGRFTVVEMDPVGNIVEEWFAAALYPERAPDGAVLVDCDTFHHEVSEMPDSEQGDFVVLSTELRTYPNYPTNETDQTQTAPTSEVVGDVLVEFDRAGNVVNRISMFDLLNPYRICYDSLAGFWDLAYDMTGTRDWSHGNAVIFNPPNRTYIVSLRSQEVVLKAERDSGQLLWIMGPHGNWNPPWSQYLLTPVGTGPFEWQYHQHAPEIMLNGDFLLFDNGNGRAVPPAPPTPWAQRYSRAVQYDIDEAALTIEQTWAYGGPPPAEQFYSGSRGDADRMKVTGNVLVTDSNRNSQETGGISFARLVEVTHTDPPQVVFEHFVRDQAATNARTWAAYRAEKLVSVYPHL